MSQQFGQELPRTVAVHEVSVLVVLQFHLQALLAQLRLVALPVAPRDSPGTQTTTMVRQNMQSVVFAAMTNSARVAGHPTKKFMSMNTYTHENHPPELSPVCRASLFRMNYPVQAARSLLQTYGICKRKECIFSNSWRNALAPAMNS